MTVSDTRGNKSFLAARMHKTSSLSPRYVRGRVLPVCTGPMRVSFVHACRTRVSSFVSGQEYRDDAISTYVTRPNEHLSRWETKPHGFVCSTLFFASDLFPTLNLAFPTATGKAFAVLLYYPLFWFFSVVLGQLR